MQVIDDFSQDQSKLLMEEIEEKLSVVEGVNKEEEEIIVLDQVVSDHSLSPDYKLHERSLSQSPTQVINEFN